MNGSTARRSLGVGDGLRAFGGGIGFIVGTPRVWGYALVPFLMMTVLACGFGWLGVWLAGQTGTAVFGSDAGFWGQTGSWALSIVAGAVCLLIAVLLAILFAQPLSGFALEAIARAQEKELTGWTVPQPPFLSALFLALRIALVTLIVGGSVGGVLFAVGIVFQPALVITVPLKFLLGGWLLAWNFVDYPLSLHGLGVGARLAWAGRHWEAFTAFGLAWAVLLLVPGVFLLVLPMGVAGAARLVVAGALEERSVY
jgi:CysZ protein